MWKEFVQTLVSRADQMQSGYYPLWHGWALRDAFWAGIDFAQSETTLQGWKPGEPRVVCAAIRDKLGRIVTGARHFDAVMLEQIRRTVPDQDAFRTAEQGFIDQRGNFLTREEAMVIATKWGQIIRDDEGRQSLYSENLY